MTRNPRRRRKQNGSKMLKTVDLFSGIGGFARGFEATGLFRTTCFVEQDPFCQAVLKHHWPDVPILDDITDAQLPDFPEPRPDRVCGGFPCPPFSQAGKQQAQDDPRHLWPEMLGIIRELRPTWVVGENVVGLVRLGLDEVLTDLEGEGYATRTFNIPACATGAPHLRQRIWVVAHSDSESEPDQPLDGGAGARQLGFEFVADPKSVHGEWPVQKRNSRGKPEKKAGDRSSLVADSDNARRRGAAEQGSSRDRRPSLHGEDGEAVADTNRSGQCEQRGAEPVQKEQSAPECTGSRNRPEEWWEVEPSVGRVVDGLPNRVSQLRALGNSIVPQIAERIGYAIGTAHEQ